MKLCIFSYWLDLTNYFPRGVFQFIHLQSLHRQIPYSIFSLIPSINRFSIFCQSDNYEIVVSCGFTDLWLNMHLKIFQIFIGHSDILSYTLSIYISWFLLSSFYVLLILRSFYIINMSCSWLWCFANIFSQPCSAILIYVYVYII